VGLFGNGRQRVAFSIGISLRIHLVLVLGSVASGCVIPQVRVLLLLHVESGLPVDEWGS
jgi:hypothetical protein